MQERLQKIISRAGITSRRASEELIEAGRVRVNGRVVTELGAKADPRADTIEVDGKRLVSEAARYIVLHKPRNVVSTLSDPEGRPTVAEILESAGTRLYPVGRLDFATSGVLLATNDGDFANGLLHPRGGVPKTYVVKVRGLMTDEDLERWSVGVVLEDGKTLPAEVRMLRLEDDKTWFEITIREGRNQQIRRMGEATGFPVMRLARVSFAGITHENLRPGDFRSLTVEELEDLRKRFGVPKRIRGAAVGESGVTPARGKPRRALPEREGKPQRRGDERPSHEAAPRERSTRERATRERSTRERATRGRTTVERATRDRAAPEPITHDRTTAERSPRKRPPRDQAGGQRGAGAGRPKGAPGRPRRG